MSFCTVEDREGNLSPYGPIVGMGNKSCSIYKGRKFQRVSNLVDLHATQDCSTTL